MLDTPAYTTVSPINIKGRQGQRLMTVYRTIGCTYDKDSKGCTMCDFAAYADPRTTSEHIIKQHSQPLETLTNMEYIHYDLLTLGNFYNDKEITPELRAYMLKSLSAIPELKRVLTESRRQHLTEEKLRTAKECLRSDQTLEFALGYESVDPYIRNTILNKGTPEKHLDESLQICKQAGVDFVSYVLIKPHTLTERQGIKEAVDTAIHVLSKAEQYGVYARIAFEPVFVTKGKIIEDLWRNGEYVPPKLWSVAQVIIETAERLGVENTKGRLFVGLSDENLSEKRMTANCGTCDYTVRKVIQDFNGHQQIGELKKLDHSCKAQWKQDIGE